MYKSTQSMWMLGALAVALSAAPLYAQHSDTQSRNAPTSQSQQQQPDQSQQQPSQPPAGSDAQAQPPDDSQTFSGTIAKSGDKYVLQDASGKTYDVDHQAEVKKFEGKQVRIKGTLDPDGKTIHIK
jgi:hemolysin activation/secretion protein